MYGTDWLKCACYVGTGCQGLLVQRRPPFHVRGWIYIRFPGDLPTFLGSFVLRPEDGGFPWGEDVEPDH